MDPRSHHVPLPAHGVLGALERAPHRHPALRELEWPPSPAPCGGFLGSLSAGPIPPQMSCEIPPSGPGPREPRCVLCLLPQAHLRRDLLLTCCFTGTFRSSGTFPSRGGLSGDQLQSCSLSPALPRFHLPARFTRGDRCSGVSWTGAPLAPGRCLGSPGDNQGAGETLAVQPPSCAAWAGPARTDRQPSTGWSPGVRMAGLT